MRLRGLAFALQIAFTLSIIMGASSTGARAEIDTTCKENLNSQVPRFLAGSEPANDNPLFSLLRLCGDKTALGALLEALTHSVPGHEPIEIAGAVEAALASPELAGDPTATELIVERFGAVGDPDARASLAYLLGWRDAAPALIGILRDDSAPQVRAAAAVALRNCKPPPDFSGLWRAARSDPDQPTRARAYQTLDRFGQVRTADELLAASRNQTDAANTGRFLGRWLAASKVPGEQTAAILAHLAEHTGSSEASGALAEIFDALQAQRPSLVAMAATPPAPPMPPGSSPSIRMAPLRSLPIAVTTPPETDLQRALYARHEQITRAAIAQFAASRDMQEDAARGAIDCALAVNRCDAAGCERLNEMLGATDRMIPPLALEASHDISSKVGALYFVRRHRQYALIFSLAFLVAFAASTAGFARARARLLAIGIGWLLILIVATVLQFTSGADIGVRVWPPLRLWPATALGSVIVTLLIAVAVTLACDRKWLLLAALIFGEITWWVLPMLLTADGITMKMQHYSRGEDWLPFMLAIFMVIGGPLLTLAVSGAAWRIQGMLLPRSAES